MHGLNGPITRSRSNARSLGPSRTIINLPQGLAISPRIHAGQFSDVADVEFQAGSGAALQISQPVAGAKRRVVKQARLGIIVDSARRRTVLGI